MTEPITRNTVLYDLDDAFYHRDLLIPSGSLSVTSARKLLPPSCPARFHYERTHPEQGDNLDKGSVIHTLILGAGSEIVVVDADDWRSKAAQAKRDEARAEGKAPVLRAFYEDAKAAADAVKRHPIAGLLLIDGDPEVSLFWQDDPTGVWRRGRADFIRTRTPGGRLILVDVKSTVSANPEKFAKSCVDYGYAQQAAGLIEGAVACGLADSPDDVAFLFVLVEKERPNLVSVVELDAEALRVGAALNRQAVDLYAKCQAADEWHAYGNDIALVSLPAWFTRQMENTA